MKKLIVVGGVVLAAVMLAGCGAQQKAGSRQWVRTDTGRWLVHDMNRPAPAVVTPGTASCGDKAGTASSDAVVLFGGKDVSAWEGAKNPAGPFPWSVGDGYIETVKDAGYIQSKQKFGLCQLHVEFATPAKAIGKSQGRGNSGVFLMGRYEVQVLDSYNNRTYADGQCGALYGRSAPLVNVCRRPGEWQSYDIIFHRPIFRGGRVVRKARFTVLQNGVLIQDNVEIAGSTGWAGPHSVTPYEPHGDKGPIALQDHGNPVRYRNIWVRPLKD